MVLVIAHLVGTLAQFHNGQCPRSGVQCNGCQLVDECSEQDGVFVIRKTPVETCTGNEACDASTNVPKCEAGATCRYKRFTCPPNLTEEEVFPDAYSCVEYHVCKDGHATDFTCGPRQIFDPKKKECTYAEDDACSTTTVPLCEEADKIWSIPGTEYQYVCMEEFSPYHAIYPQIRLKATADSSTSDSATQRDTSPTSEATASAATQQGTSPTSEAAASASTQQGTSPTSEAASSAATQQGTSPTSEAETSASTQQGTSPTSEATTSMTASTVNLTTTTKPSPCASGPGIYEDPDDCRKYFACHRQPDGSISLIERMCHPGSHFDGSAKRCVPGSCSHYPSSTAMTPTAPPFNCTSVGIFEDKECCKCYYVCRNLRVIQKCCHSGSHFNPGVGMCTKPDTCGNCSGCPPSAYCKTETVKLGPNYY